MTTNFLIAIGWPGGTPSEPVPLTVHLLAALITVVVIGGLARYLNRRPSATGRDERTGR